MSTFKKVISVVLCIAMLAGSFTMLGGLATPDAAAADGVSKVKTYEELAAQYDNFIYLASEVYEIETTDGTLSGTVTDSVLTDYYVDAGQLLEERFYIKGDFYFGNSQFVKAYDNAFFDVTQITTAATDSTGYSTAYTGVVNPENPVVIKHDLQNMVTSADCATENWMKMRSGYSADELAVIDYVQSVITFSGNKSDAAYVFDDDSWLVSWVYKVKEGLADGTTGYSKTLPGFWNCGDATEASKQTTWMQRKGTINIATKPANSTEAEDNAFASTNTKSSYVNYDLIENFLFGDLAHTFTIGANPDDAPAGPAGPVEGTSKVKSYADLAAQYDNFIYLASDIYEIETADGTLSSAVTSATLTDYYVDAGQLLEERFFIKGDFYFGNSQFVKAYDNAFFDVTQITTAAVDSTGYSTAYTGVVNPENPVVIKHDLQNMVTSADCATENWMKMRSGYSADELKVIDYVQSVITFSGNKSDAAYVFDDDVWLVSWVYKVKDGLADGTTGYSKTLPGFWNCGDATEASKQTTWMQRKGTINIATRPADATEADDDAFASTNTKSSYVNYSLIEHFIFSELEHHFTIGKAPAGGSTYTATFEADGKVVSTATLAAGASIAAPEENPTKDGYTFKGWALEGTTEILTFPQTMGSANVKYVAIFEEVAKYTATFVSNGVTLGTAEYEAGATIAFPDAGTKTGYSFTGWSPASTTMPATDTTFTAQWSANTYTVSFYAEKGGAVYQTLNVTFDGAYTTPATPPTKTGYTAAGWVDANGNAMPAKHTVDGNVSYYANWVAGTFTATFKANGGVFADGKDTYTVDVEFGQAITAPADPTKTGNVFLGWTPAVGNMTAEGMTFTAQWEAAKIAVYFMDGERVIEEKTGDYGSQISPSGTPSKDGYTFAGWKYADGSAASFPITLGTEAVYVYATWNAKSYYIEFYAPTESDWLDGGNQLCGDPIATPDAPSQTGYNFVGWFDADGNAMPETVPAVENQVYYAKYEPIMYKATFDADGGVFADGESTYVFEGIYGSTIVKPANPTKTGYTFNKWSPTVPNKMGAKDATYKATWTVQNFTIEYYIDGELKNTETYAYGAAITAWAPSLEAGVTFSGWGDQVPATMPAENLKVYGTTGADTFTVTFTINGEVYTTVPVAFGAAVVAPEYTAKEGYTFSGWDVPATMPAQNITIDATETINTYNVYFYIDESADEPYEVVPTVYGAEIELPEDPTVLGKEFYGWLDVPETMPAGDVTVYGDWGDIEYIAEFYDAAGEIVYEDVLYWGDVIAAEDVPEVTKEGFEFKYWTVNGDAVTFPLTIDEAIADNENNTLAFEPYFSIVGYDVIYYVDGQLYKTESYEFGAAVTILPDPTKTGYTFSGWDKQLPATMPAEDIVVNGTFTVNQYNAKFYVDGTLVATVPTNYGEVPAAPDVANAKPGYTFQGWNPALAAMGTADVDYNAVFTAAGDTPYTIEYYTMDVNGAYGAAETETKTGATDTVVTLNVTAPTGFTLDTDASELEGTIAADGSLVLKVYYIRNQYTFKTVVDGVEAEATYYYDAAVETPAAPEKIGYTFDGWSPEVPATMPAKDVTVEAQWTINQYTITFVDTGDVAYEEITLDYNAAVGTIKDPVKTGYTFNGWDNEVPVNMPANDVVLTAQWTINQYTITFVDTGDVAYEDITQDYNTAVVPVADPVKTGYTFKGWDVEVPTVMPAVNTTVTAIWEINYYNAIFDINGTIVTKRTAYNAMPEIPDASRIGYTFDGWSPEVTAMPANDVTYVAQYTANTYAVIFDADGGKWADGDAQKSFDVVFDTDITAPAEEPTREGYKFAGWDHEVGKLTSVGDTFKAVWTQDLSFCRISKVERVTPVTSAALAKYEITVKESPIKIQIACTDGSGYTWTYDRNDEKVADNLVDGGLVSVVSYDAAGAVLSADDIAAGAVVDHEVWTIVTIIPEGNYKVRAKVNYSNESWEDINFAYDFTHEYDEVVAEEDMIVSVAVAAPAVKRGTANPVTIVTSDKVARLRITMTVDGSTKTVSYTPSSSVVDWKDNGDGTSTWVLNIRFTYTGTADEQLQNWTIWYRETGSTKWIETDESFEVKVTKYEPVEKNEEATYAPFTVVSVSAAASVKKATYTPITIVVTSDATKVRINNQAGKATTYMASSKNVESVVDNGNGTSTWTINYRFATAETRTWAVECRGNTWSAITDVCLFTITVTE